MNIRSAKVDQLVERLARLTGEDVETAIERAIEERLSRVAPPTTSDRKAAMDVFFERVSHMPVLDPRPAEEILSYDGSGLPSWIRPRSSRPSRMSRTARAFRRQCAVPTAC